MPQESGNQNCVFCLIASEKIEGYKISEIEEAIAVLEINPVSKGHTMVLPKQHLQLKEMKSKIVIFAQKLASQLKEKLKSKDIELATVDFQGHGIINLIPVYNDESISSPRHKASQEELQEVQDLFVKEKEIRKKEILQETKKQIVEQTNRENEEESEKSIKEEQKTQEVQEIEKQTEKESEKEKSVWFPRRIP